LRRDRGAAGEAAGRQHDVEQTKQRARRERRDRHLIASTKKPSST
jgi:hypothetical protein